MRILLFCVAILAFLPAETFSIPSFARTYQVSCTTCHSPVPTLTKFGDEFERNAYQMPGREMSSDTVGTGDDKLFLLRTLPLSIRFDGFLRYLPDDQLKSDIESPALMKIISAGTVAPDISYFLYFLFTENGEVGGVEDAFFYFMDAFNTGVNITAGQFQVADAVIKRELRPTFEDYAIYTLTPGQSTASLTYDRGIILSYEFPTTTLAYLSVVNGNGIGGANGLGHFDDDPYKNFILHVEQPVGSDISVGALGYLGKQRTSGNVSDTRMIGANATFRFGHVELLGQYLHREDTNPFFTDAVTEKTTLDGGFAQVVYAPEFEKSDWYLTGLYNNTRSPGSGIAVESVTGNFSYLLRRNLKLMVEYTLDMQLHRNNFTLGMVTAF